MNENEQIRRTIAKLGRLSSSGAEFWLWHPGGTSLQPYRCADPITDDELQRLENKYRIRLPDEYRSFLIHVGNGGAGPGIGLERFGYVDSGAMISTGRPSGPTLVLTQPNLTVHYRELIDDKGNRVDPFDVNFYSSIRDRAPDGRCGPDAPSRPFPLSAPFHDTGESMEDWEAVNPYDGVWCLANEGCDIKVNLVLNGPYRGQVWIYEPCDGGGYTPFGEQANFNYRDPLTDPTDQDRNRVFTFLDWYEHWLDHTLGDLGE